MKRVIASIVSFLVVIITTNTEAGYWSIHCENASCVASQGALKVYWMAAGINNIYQGKLTGVEGIPISIEDYQAVEKKIESTIEKTITRKKGSDTNVKADAPEGTGGPSAGRTDSKENLFSKKRSMSQSKTMGKKVNVDYTLAFVEWLGDTRFILDKSIKRYWVAAEMALNAYKNGNIEELIEQFFIARNAEAIEDVAVNAKLTDETKALIMTKYIGLTRFPLALPTVRYALASQAVYNISNNTEEAVKVSNEYKQDMENLSMLIRPGQTALKLYKSNPELAFLKWLADNHRFVKNINDMPLEDKYLVAISVFREIKADLLDDADKSFFKEERQEFEAAIKAKDKSVQIVTVKGSPIPVIPVISIVAVSAVIIGAIYIGTRANRKKKNNTQEVINEG